MVYPRHKTTQQHCDGSTCTNAARQLCPVRARRAHDPMPQRAFQPLSGWGRILWDNRHVPPMAPTRMEIAARVNMGRCVQHELCRFADTPSQPNLPTSFPSATPPLLSCSLPCVSSFVVAMASPTRPLRILLATTSELKRKAVESVWGPSVKITCVSAVSGVPEQPRGIVEAREGAQRRLRSAVRSSTCSLRSKATSTTRREVLAIGPSSFSTTANTSRRSSRNPCKSIPRTATTQT